MGAQATSPAVAMVGFGQVRHTRLRPTRHAFAYSNYFLMLPMRSLRAHGNGHLARNRWAGLSFFDADHGDCHGPMISDTEIRRQQSQRSRPHDDTRNPKDQKAL